MASTDEILLKVQEYLRDSPYACSSLVKLTGGTANFVYRGTLLHPLEGDGSKTVVIKHTPPYVASSPEFKLTDTRCEFEKAILIALHDLAPSNHSNVKIQTPRLYHFASDNNTQIYSDLQSSTELKTYALSHALTKEQSLRVGQSLGLWTKKFHTWGQAPEQQTLRENMKGNVAMKDLKFMMNYETLVNTVKKFPGMLEKSEAVFKEIREDVRVSLRDAEGFLIHGDFWSGNVLLPNAPLPSDEHNLEMYIIDWELSHLSSTAFDLGQMFAELFELKHFKDIDAGVWLIEGFMQGYGTIKEDFAFKTAIHVGVHLIVWGSRVPGWGTEEQIEKVVEVGNGFVVEAWAKNKAFFAGTALECLFK